MLIDEYMRILEGLNSQPFDFSEDHYSGVFLPVPFEEYWESHPRVMLVGRETAGWNTNNGKNTISRIVRANLARETRDIVAEAVDRYRNHLNVKPDGKIVTRSRSSFKQYFFRLAKEFNRNPKSIVYSNLFAWDYKKGSPRQRPEQELAEVVMISSQLLAAQIRNLRPHFIIFATGYEGIDPVIRQLFNKHFDGYVNTAPVIPKKLWEFQAAGATCFRIAHPRATHGHGEFRQEVIERIRGRILAESL